MSDIPLSVMMGLGAREEEEPSVELGPGETSLHFFQRVYRDPAQPCRVGWLLRRKRLGLNTRSSQRLGLGT
jgi:hypothetical protein